MLLKSLLYFTGFVGLSQAVLQSPGFFRSSNIDNVPTQVNGVLDPPAQANETQTVNLTNTVISPKNSLFESSIAIDPNEMNLTVRGVSKDVGDKIITQIRDQMGKDIISLDELRTRLEPQKITVPATLVNKTVVTEVQETIVTNKTARMVPVASAYSLPIVSYEPAPKNYARQSPEPGSYVPQDYFYHPEPEVKYSAPVYQQPEAPKYQQLPQVQSYEQPQAPKYQQYEAPKYQQPQAPKYQEPQAPKYQEPQAPKYQEPQAPKYQAPSQQYDYKPPTYETKVECQPQYQEPKIVYRYIEVCSKPQYQKPQKLYEAVAPKKQGAYSAPKVVVKQSSSNGYTETYSNQNTPNTNYNSAPNYPKATVQPAYGQDFGQGMAADADVAFQKIRNEIAEKFRELDVLKKQAEENFAKRPSFPEFKSYQIPKMPVNQPEPYNMPAYGNDDDIKLKYTKETETYRQ